VRPEGLCQWNIPMTLPGVEPATYGLVAQCLNLKTSSYTNQLYACGTPTSPRTVWRMTWCRINTYEYSDVSERRTASIHRLRRSPETSLLFYDTTQHQSSVSALRTRSSRHGKYFTLGYQHARSFRWRKIPFFRQGVDLPYGSCWFLDDSCMTSQICYAYPLTSGGAVWVLCCLDHSTWVYN
jgi:hypothetical protein